MRRNTHGRRGFSVMEVAVASSIMLAVAVGMGAAVAVASRSMPGEESPTRDRVRGVDGLARMAEEISAALHVASPALTSITFTVADRTGDGLPERVVYSWDGTAGSPLTRSVNGGPAVPVVHDVRSFQFNYKLKTVVESYPGPEPDWPEELLFTHTSVLDNTEQDINDKTCMSQYFVPVLASDAVSWSVTRVQFVGRQKDTKPNTLHVQIRQANADGTPTGTVLEEALIPQASLPKSATWIEQAFSNVVDRAPGTGLCFYLGTPDPPTAKITYRSKGVSMGGSALLITDPAKLPDPGALRTDRAMLINVYGKVKRNVPVPAVSVTRYFLEGVRIVLRAGLDKKDTVLETTFVNAPEAMSTRFYADFTADATAQDFNGDGSPDFKLATGDFSAGVGGSGVVNPTTPIVLNTTSTLSKTTDVRVDLRDTTAGGGGASLWIEADRSGSTYAAFEVLAVAQADGTQAVTVSTKTGPASSKALVWTTVKGGAWARVRLLIDPQADRVAVWVDDQHLGTFGYTRVTDGSNLGVRLEAKGSDAGAEFGSFSLAVGN